MEQEQKVDTFWSTPHNKLLLDVVDLYNSSEREEQTLTLLNQRGLEGDAVDESIVQKLTAENEHLKGRNENDIWSNSSPAQRETSTEIQNRNLLPKEAEYFGSYDLEVIGLNGTAVRKIDYDKIVWRTAGFAVLQLLRLVFDRRTLATHTLRGRCVLKDRPLSSQLDPLRVADIIYCVKKRFNMRDFEIRRLIAQKRVCAAISWPKKLM